MTSDKTFTPEEFHQKLKDFAQSMANKVQGSQVFLKQDVVTGGFLVTIKTNDKDQTSLFTLDRNGHVTMTNVLGDIN